MSGQRSVDQWLAENYIPQFKRQESGRDPFCPVSDHIPEPCPFCNALVKARAEIRERIAQEIEAQPIDAWGSQAPRGPVTLARREAHLRAARIARGGESE